MYSLFVSFLRFGSQVRKTGNGVRNLAGILGGLVHLQHMPKTMGSHKGLLSEGRGKRSDPLYQAQAILSRRDHAEAEVRRKLKQKGFVEPQIEGAVAWLKQHRLLNDEAFARMYVENTLRFKPTGPRLLTLKLKQRGVEPALIEKVMAESFVPGRETELIQQAALKRRVRSLQEPREYLRLQRWLLSRGFSPSSVDEYLQNLRRAT